MKRARAIFFGTPEFAVPSLRALSEVADVVLVVTQPDRPSGRGMKLAAPPVKQLALTLGLPVLQPAKVRTPEFAAQLRALHADLAVVVAYGRILTAGVLAAPRLGCVNVHASLLPKLRGAAPIHWAIVRGDTEAGVCLMQLDEGMDTGPVLARASLSVGADETAGGLTERLSVLGAELLQRELPRFLCGELPATPQDDAQATLAPVLQKEHGEIDWEQSANRVHDLVRGMSPWPGAYTHLDSMRVKVHGARVKSESGRCGDPGTIISIDADGVTVACAQGSLLITELQRDGSRRMPAAAFAAGQRLPSGARFAKRATPA